MKQNRYSAHDLELFNSILELSIKHVTSFFMTLSLMRTKWNMIEWNMIEWDEIVKARS